MADPILLPASALPGLLRASCPMSVTYSAGIGTDIVQFIDERTERAVLVGDGNDSGFSSIDVADLSVDLRDPAVRDAVCRWLWARLRPGEPEPLTAPRFRYSMLDGLWWLDRVFPFRGEPGGVVWKDERTIPALADIRVVCPECDGSMRAHHNNSPPDGVPCDKCDDGSPPDRDLLALRCVALAVGGAR